MIFVTGDTHGGIDIKKLNSKCFQEGKKMTKSDYVIIAGDFGFVWNGSNEDKYWLKWFNNKSFTTLFVDGNHENFDLLNSYSIEMWNGGKVHRINNSVIHLMRGQVYTINGLKFFTFGGAKSSDIEYRKEGVSWWKEEMPSDEEYLEGMKNLKAVNFKVDYIITHTYSQKTLSIINLLKNSNKEVTEIHRYFDEIERKTEFKHWYFGHSHKDIEITEMQTMVYQKVIRIL